VQLQAQQQALIAAQNAYEKNLILLKREIGIDPARRLPSRPGSLQRTGCRDTEEVRAIAFKNRQTTRPCRIRRSR